MSLLWSLLVAVKELLVQNTLIFMVSVGMLI